MTHLRIYFWLSPKRYTRFYPRTYPRIKLTKYHTIYKEKQVLSDTTTAHDIPSNIFDLRSLKKAPGVKLSRSLVLVPKLSEVTLICLHWLTFSFTNSSQGSGAHHRVFFSQKVMFLDIFEMYGVVLDIFEHNFVKIAKTAVGESQKQGRP